VKTNSSGVWKVSNLAPRSYPVNVTLAGYQTQTGTLTVVSGKTIVATTTLVP